MLNDIMTIYFVYYYKIKALRAQLEKPVLLLLLFFTTMSL